MPDNHETLAFDATQIAESMSGQLFSSSPSSVETVEASFML